MSHTDQDTYRETLESIVEQVIRPAAARIDETGSFPSEAMKALADNGLLGLISATEVGGSGHGLRAAVLAVERAAREAQRRGGDRGAKDVEIAHRQLEPLTRRSDQGVGRDAAAFEAHGRHRMRGDATASGAPNDILTAELTGIRQ